MSDTNVQESRRTMYVTEADYSAKTTEGFWKVYECVGVVRPDTFVDDETRDVPCERFYPDGWAGHSAGSEGYPIGHWAFATEGEAKRVCAENGLRPVLEPMREAVRQLALAMEALVMERTKRIERAGPEAARVRKEP